MPVIGYAKAMVGTRLRTGGHQSADGPATPALTYVAARAVLHAYRQDRQRPALVAPPGETATTRAQVALLLRELAQLSDAISGYLLGSPAGAEGVAALHEIQVSTISLATAVRAQGWVDEQDASAASALVTRLAALTGYAQQTLVRVQVS